MGLATLWGRGCSTILAVPRVCQHQGHGFVQKCKIKGMFFQKKCKRMGIFMEQFQEKGINAPFDVRLDNFPHYMPFYCNFFLNSQNMDFSNFVLIFAKLS